MNKLKERLFGLIVVIALGVIFIPMLLENTQNSKSNVLQDVPAASLAKNDLNKDQKPEVLAQLKNAPKDKPAVVDETQPIADAKTPGHEEDLKVKEKEETIAKAHEQEAKAQAEEKAKLEQQKKLEQAKIDQQKKLEQAQLAEQEKIEQEKAKAKLEQDKRRLMEIEQAKVENAKLEQAKLEEEKRQKALQAQAEKSKAALAQEKQEAAKREQEKLAQVRSEQEKREQAKREQVKLEQAEFERARRQEKNKQEVVSESKIHQPTKVKSRASHHGWVVQMGSFAEPHNASALLRKLKAAGYPAFTRKACRQGMDLTIVMVGPHARREDANRLCSALAMKFQIDGILVRYEPH